MVRQRLDISPKNLIEGLLNVSLYFDVAVILSSNRSELHQADKYARYDVLAAFGAKEQMIPETGPFDSLYNFQKRQGWKFGFLTYDLKNELEDLASENHDGIKAPTIHFFIPRMVVYLKDEECFLEYDEEESEHAKDLIKNLNTPLPDFTETESTGLIERVPHEKYIQNAEAIRQQIQLGNIYEMNYCVEFFSAGASINPQQAYLRLNDISPMPFSAFYKLNGKYIISASPERFLAKRGNKIISQPIKGTIRRGRNAMEDEHLKKKLQEDPKERSENVMIVDLVRNDLSRTAAKGSVVVEELFGIYTFRNLHQMISTVVSEMKPGVDAVEVIRSAFPMGSMTGAPKVSAMRLIENFEDTARGIYSGAIGYFDPVGDFDFNVVIRSIVYNEDEKYLSCMAGSAITINSIPENEYAECRLKAETMLSVLRPGYGKSTEADNARKTDGIHITK